MGYRVLIVDDDMNFRYAMKEAIPWIQNGFEVVGEAMHGAQALEFLETRAADIILTDMDMPIMNGVALTEAVMSRYPQTVIVALSAYDDFEFVKESMRLGAKDYILKQKFDGEAIVETLLKICRKEGEKHDRTLEREEEARLFAGYLLGGQEWKEQPEGIFQKIASEKQLGLCIVRAEPDRMLSFKKEKERFASNLIYQCKGNETDWLFLFRIQERNGGIHQYEEFQAAARGLEAWLKPCVVGCCDCAGGFDQLPKLYQKARLALDYEIYFPKKQLFFYSEMLELEQRRKATYLYQHSEQLAMTNLDTVKSVLEDMVARILEYKPVEEYVNKNFVNLYNEYRKKMSLHSNALEAIQYYDEIKKRRLVTEKQEYTMELITSDWKKNVILYTGNNVEISKALEYVQQHYAEELSLKQIADLAGLSENYFSSLFKQEMGENLITYINRVRIQHAKQMLRSETMKVYEVAEKVGYRNTTYFSTIFKKVTGMSVSEYKGGLLR